MSRIGAEKGGESQTQKEKRQVCKVAEKTTDPDLFILLVFGHKVNDFVTSSHTAY